MAKRGFQKVQMFNLWAKNSTSNRGPHAMEMRVVGEAEGNKAKFGSDLVPQLKQYLYPLLMDVILYALKGSFGDDQIELKVPRSDKNNRSIIDQIGSIKIRINAVHDRSNQL